MRTSRWPEVSAVWPRYASLWIMVGSILILAKNRLPEWFQPFLVEERTFGEPPEDSDLDEGAPPIEEEEKSDVSGEITSIHSPVMAMVFILGYFLLGLLIGFFWATPFFVASYAKFFGIASKVNALITVISTICAYGFWHVINVDITGGYLFDGFDYLRIVQRFIRSVLFVVNGDVVSLLQATQIEAMLV